MRENTCAMILSKMEVECHKGQYYWGHCIFSFFIYMNDPMEGVKCYRNTFADTGSDMVMTLWIVYLSHTFKCTLLYSTNLSSVIVLHDHINHKRLSFLCLSNNFITSRIFLLSSSFTLSIPLIPIIILCKLSTAIAFKTYPSFYKFVFHIHMSELG